jgi:hypothetical protein
LERIGSPVIGGVETGEGLGWGVGWPGEGCTEGGGGGCGECGEERSEGAIGTFVPKSSSGLMSTPKSSDKFPQATVNNTQRIKRNTLGLIEDTLFFSLFSILLRKAAKKFTRLNSIYEPPVIILVQTLGHGGKK